MNQNQCPICQKILSSKGALEKHKNKKIKCKEVDQLKNSCNTSYMNNIILTNEQKEIVNTDLSKNIRIIAGAGCAKTTTLLFRIKFLIESGIDPKSIILTTFTKDASNDMQQKLNLLINNKKILVGTIDSISKRVVDKYCKDDNNQNCYVGEYKIKFFNFLKKKDCPNKTKFLSSIKYLFVDEYQDINSHYYNIIEQLYKDGIIITVVGDDAQNIYTWNGSNIKYILKFKEDFQNSESYFLTNNYRSTPEILEIANQSIKKNENQIYKIIKSNVQTINFKPSITYYYSWDKEYLTIKTLIKKYISIGFRYHDIVILCRNCTDNGPLFFFETNLTKNNIPNCLLEGKKDIRSKIKEDHVCLSTIHKSKGLEWPIVFIIGCEDKFFPSNKDPEKIEEERRLFYVGITRAKYYLHLSLSTKKDPCITRFITELDTSLFNFINTFRVTKKVSYSEPRFLELSVTKLIENLKTDHYLDLKEKKIIPELKWEQKQLYKEKTYQDFIMEKDLFADFGIFLDNLISRQIGDIDKESNGRSDYNANKVIAKVVLNCYQFSIYKTYKTNFICNLKYIELYNYNSIIKSLESKKNIEKSNSEYIKTIDKNDYSTIFDIIELIKYNSIKYNISKEDIPIFSENLLPVDFIKEMENSYLKYTNDYEWKDIVFDIYKVSRSNNILRGRSRLLYTPITSQDIKLNLDLYNEIYCEYIMKYCQGKNTCKPNVTYMGIYGEIDAICDNIIIDYKNSCQKNIQIEHIVQLLIYVVMCQKNNYNIDKIRIFNPIKGIISTADISDWNKQDQLINYILSIREKIMNEQKKTIDNFEQINSITISTPICLFLEDDSDDEEMKSRFYKLL